ncbi:protein-methionine-sulfoxide reductase heme-binding subunit MsrQ [Epibacterium ulvae]|uniref:protein-methionine-sulfoxide reductase heme-binding subunit MsrQ n=1 Tax=Epibacterium ulvae TaxID=1156985 RepID=UPI000B7D3BC0|nr:protein-methionine-sulfoxide reductase heme-binding subunit MsrQ [Epibacterium ulvae]
MSPLNSWIRRLPVWVVYLLGVLPAPWLFYLGLIGDLGADPVKAIEHRYGELALQLVIAGLAITPLRRHLGLNLMKFRRAIGLLCFFYVSCHLLVWLVLDVQILNQILTDILKRPYITLGMLSFIAMVPLAVTSNNASVRGLGRRWQRLHRLTYLAAVLGGLHYVLLAKGFQVAPLIYLGMILCLMLIRVGGVLIDWFWLVLDAVRCALVRRLS